MAYYKKSKFDILKCIGIVFAVLFAIALAFAITLATVAAIKDVTFAAQFNDWFNIGKETAETTAHLILNM